MLTIISMIKKEAVAPKKLNYTPKRPRYTCQATYTKPDDPSGVQDSNKEELLALRQLDELMEDIDRPVDRYLNIFDSLSDRFLCTL